MHIPVLLNEVLECLAPEAGYTYIDGTLGMGGHSKAILDQTNGLANLIGIDRDVQSLEIARQNLKNYPNCQFLHGRFSQIPELIDKNQLSKPTGGILLDLGISSYQLDSSKYGLSFQNINEALDMRLDPWCKISAEKILNEWPEKKLSDLFWDIADFRPARKLAKTIVQNRPIKTIGQFVEICNFVHKVPRAATLPFMALRIAVNEELQELEKGLNSIIEWLEPSAKLLVISFHSGEDRIVKNVFKNSLNLKNLFKKPLSPTLSEIKKNSRSHSAKLRVAVKIP